MAESKYESKITSSPCPIEQVYRVLSDMRSLEKVKDLIPKDKIQEMEIAAAMMIPFIGCNKGGSSSKASVRRIHVSN